MSNWQNRYERINIPGPIPVGVITEHKPGQKLAEAITEIQEKAAIKIELELDGIEDRGSRVTDNTIYLDLKVDETLPPGGTQYQVLQRNAAGDAVWDYVRAVEVT